MIAEQTKVEQKLAHRALGIRNGCIGVIHFPESLSSTFVTFPLSDDPYKDLE